MSDIDEKDQEKKSERKEKVIHTRVSEALEEDLKKTAGALGVSVSNLVRNVLLNASGLVEHIVSDSASVARAARGDEEPVASTDKAPDAAPVPGPDQRAPVILGWQEAILNLNALCDRCNGILPKGMKAAIAILDRPGPKAIRCLACLAELGTEGRPTD